MDSLTGFAGAQDGWLQGDPCDSAWYGITCNEENSHVTVLRPISRFDGNRLIGYLPASLGNLTEVREIYLSTDVPAMHSELEGAVPDAIGQLGKLQCFYISHSHMTSLPTFTSPFLQGLYARYNKLVGSFPDVRQNTNISHLWVDHNYLTGSLDGSGIENLGNLHHLHMESNGFSGVLPDTLCNVHSCHAADNDWACPIPERNGTKCCEVTTCANAHGGRFATHVRHGAADTAAPVEGGGDTICTPQ